MEKIAKCINNDCIQDEKCIEFNITFYVGSHPIIVNALMNMKLKAIADQDNTIECNAMDSLKLLIKVFNNYVIGQM